MKPLLLYLILSVFTNDAISQQLDTVRRFSPSDYLITSQRQRTAGWVFAGLGSTTLLITLIANATNAVGNTGLTIVSLGTVEPKHRSYTVPYVVGAVFIAASVPLFVASARNKNKYVKLITHLKMEKAPVMRRLDIAQYSYPCLAVTFNL